MDVSIPSVTPALNGNSLLSFLLSLSAIKWLNISILFICLFIFRQKLFGHLIRDLRLVGVWRTLLWIMEWRRKRTNKYICILVNKYVNICIRRGRDPRTARFGDRPVPIRPRFSKFCWSVDPCGEVQLRFQLVHTVGYSIKMTGSTSGCNLTLQEEKIMYQITEAVIYEFTMILIYIKS